MNNLFKLLKVNFINGSGLNAFSKYQASKETKKKLYRSSAIIILGFVGIILLVYLYANMMAEGLVMINAINVLPILAALVATIGVIFTSIYKAPGSLFSSKDYDMLMSFPIDSKIILVSKLLNLLSLNLGISASVLLPTTIVYYQRAEASPICFLYAVIGIILIPLIPTIIASLIAFGLSYASSKVKFSNLISLVGMFLVMLVFFFASTKMQDIMNFFAEKATKLEDIFGKMYPPAGWYGSLINSGDMISLVKLILISVIPFIIFVFVFGKSFKKINSRLGESYKKANYKLTSLQSESPIRALIRKELKRYISCTIYVFNTAFGTILLPIGAIATIFMKDDVIKALLGEGAMGDMLPVMLIGAFSFLMTTTCTTASSISLEGKNLWILKSLPVRVIDIFKGKIAVTLLISIPPVVLSSIIMKFSLNITLINMIWLILIPSIFAIFMSIFGLFINLSYPKLDWTQEVKVVKQSISVMITIFGGMGIIALIGGIFYKLEPTNINIFLGVVTIVLVIVTVIMWNILKTKGVELFKKL